MFVPNPGYALMTLKNAKAGRSEVTNVQCQLKMLYAALVPSTGSEASAKEFSGNAKAWKVGLGC